MAMSSSSAAPARPAAASSAARQAGATRRRLPARRRPAAARCPACAVRLGRPGRPGSRAARRRRCVRCPAGVRGRPHRRGDRAPSGPSRRPGCRGPCCHRRAPTPPRPRCGAVRARPGGVGPRAGRWRGPRVRCRTSPRARLRRHGRGRQRRRCRRVGRHPISNRRRHLRVAARLLLDESLDGLAYDLKRVPRRKTFRAGREAPRRGAARSTCASFDADRRSGGGDRRRWRAAGLRGLPRRAARAGSATGTTRTSSDGVQQVPAASRGTLRRRGGDLRPAVA